MFRIGYINSAKLNPTGICRKFCITGKGIYYFLLLELSFQVSDPFSNRIANFKTNPTLSEATTLLSDITTRGGKFENALKVYQLTQSTRNQLDTSFVNAFLHACWKFKQPNMAFRVFNDIQSCNFPLDSFSVKLIGSMCFQTKNIIVAKRALLALQQITGVITAYDCSDLIRTLSEGKQYKDVLALFDFMEKRKVNPEEFHYTLFLKACAASGSLEKGRQIHAHILKGGIKWNPYIQTTLLSMYSKCGDMATASTLFEGKATTILF